MSDRPDHDESAEFRSESRDSAPGSLTFTQPGWWPQDAPPPRELAGRAERLVELLDSGAGGAFAWAALDLAERVDAIVDGIPPDCADPETDDLVRWCLAVAESLRQAVARARGTGARMLAAKARLAAALLNDGDWPGGKALRETMEALARDVFACPFR